MQESHESGLATHIGPESCGAAREGGVEALTGERAGRLFSRVRQLLRDADAVGESGRPHLVHRYREVHQSPARSETPSTYGSTSRGNREVARWTILSSSAGTPSGLCRRWQFFGSESAGFGIARCRGAAKTAAPSGIACGASSLAGCLCLLSVIPILCGAWALLPKARAGCGKPARPDPWRGS